MSHTPSVPDADSSTLAHIRQQRIDALAQWRADGVNPYPYHFDKTHAHAELHARYAQLPAGEETAETAQVAGRIMAIRNSGMFLDVQDDSGKFQLFCHKEYLPAEQAAWLKRLDIGDWVGARGVIRRTPRGELSLKVQNLTLLSKSLRPLPEKFHGLTDVETRYRQRYLDLTMNTATRRTLTARSRIIASIRRFLDDRGFLEVETPMLQAIPGGASARPFTTHHHALDMDLYLRIAPELYLKRLMVGGLCEKIFELNRNFRNEGISPRHNPEFTMLELYEAYADYHDMMTLTEDLIAHAAQSALGTMRVTFSGKEIDLTPPWPRKSMAACVIEATDVDFMAIGDDAQARDAARRLGVHVEENDAWGAVLERVFEEKVEASLIQPIHITDYPREISPLAKEHRDDARLVERFETRINGWEVANAFSELNDPLDQRRRFEAQVAQREAGDAEAQHLDEDYLTALEFGLPPTGGLGVGIDRVVMILTDSPNIRDVIAFPTLKARR
ncbi:MAG: lysine--tRNA ligase [Vampirovibrionales bacterium]|nr:lysine--tRNA ligase [Vampirovibrionales bacterium]